MRDYSKIISFMTSTPWMMHPPAMRMMLEIIDAHIAGTMTEDHIQARLEEVRGKGINGVETDRYGSIGVLNLEGPMFPKANMLTEMSGATSLEQFQGQLNAMLADDAIDSILLNIDSPGGSSALVAETASMIREGNTIKPIYGLANTSANSAAYWLLSQCAESYATPSGQVGSLGTYFVHSDDSKQMEMRGLKDTIIKAGKYKAITMEPLTPESEAQLQSFVDETNDGFINSVAQGRNVDPAYVRENFGQGMIFTPERATGLGMIDGIATFSQLMDHATTSTNVGGGNSNGSHPGPQLSYDADKEHSEPGTGLGGEPTPREPPEEGDPAIEGGWRRDPPPPAYETEEAVNREWLEARAEALGITFNADMSDEVLAQAVQEGIDAVVVPLATATHDAVQQRQFEQDYPEQATQLRELAETTRARQSSEFAAQYERIEGTNQGYSPVVRDEIRTAYAAIETRSFSTDMLKGLIDTLSQKDAKVTYGEMGSSRAPEVVGVPTDFQAARRQFAELVSQRMTEDNLEQSAAIKLVSEENPELARMYAVGHVGH